MTTPWLASFHGGHSGSYCAHASGTLEEVVLAAIDRGFVALGISEHMPRSRTVDLYPEEIEAGLGTGDLARMFDEYAREFDRIQIQVGDRIHLLKGMECEVIPPATHVQEVERLRVRYALDYLVGSVHHVEEIPIDTGPRDWSRAAQACGSISRLVEAYFDTTVTMIETLRPEIVAHLDLIKLHAPEPLDGTAFRDGIERALQATLAAGSVLEINGRALQKGLTEPYPGANSLQRAQQLGIPVTLGDDSHGPEEVGGHLNTCRKILLEIGIDQIVHLRRGEGAQIESVPVLL